MRNLKKVLALVLALVMAMSLVTIANASDFADDDDITYEEAVDVMTAVGVLEGVGNNEFSPDTILTREQAAKILTYMLVGTSNADKLATTIAPYSDVAADRWSAGSVAYCANVGILAGVGDGKFNPTGKLTGLAFAKMLLVALGYDAEIEGLVGAKWAINTATLATSVGLIEGLEDVSLSDEMTREQAAQMALNAVESPLVEYDSKGVDFEVNGATVSFGASKASYVTTTIAKTQTISDTKLSNSNEYTIEFGEKYMTDLKKNADDTDAFMRPSTTWKVKNTVIGTYVNESDLTYTTTVELGDIYSDLGLSKSATTDGYYDNGKELTKITLSKNSKTEIAANGVLTQVWYEEEEDSQTLIITHIDTYVGKVNSVVKATDTSDRYVTLNALTNPGALNNKFETENFAAQDLITYTAAWNENSSRYDIQTVDALELTTTGVLNFTVDGTLYNYSANNYVADEDGARIDIDDFEVNKSEINVYLDQYGYAIYVSGVEAEKNYAAVIGYGAVNQYGSTSRGVTLLLPDGTQKTVTAKIDDGLTWTSYFSNDGATSYANNVNDGIADLVTYTVGDDGVYKLEIVSSTAVGATTAFQTGKYSTDADNAGTSFTNGKSLMTINTKYDDITGTEYDTAAVQNYYTTSETIFMVATQKDSTDPSKGYNYNVYTGYANAPGISAGTDINGMAFVMDGYYKNQINVVYIDAAKMAGISGVDTFFVKDGSKIITDSDGRYYVFPAIVDEQETTIKIDPAIVADWDGTGNEKLETADKDLYAIDNVVVNSKGIITSCDLENIDYFKAANGTKGTVAANEVVLGIGANKNTATYWAYNKDTAVYYVDKDYKNITVSSIDAIATDANDYVYAAYDSANKVLTDVIVVEVADTVTVTYGVAPSTGVEFWNGSAWVTSLADVAKDTVVYVRAADATMKPVINGITLTFSHYDGATAVYTFSMPAYNIAAGAFTTTSAGYAISNVTLTGGSGVVNVTITGNAALTAATTAGATVSYDAVLLRSAGGTGSWLVDPGAWNGSNQFTGVSTSTGSDGFKVQVTAKINGVAVATFESNGYLLTIS